MEEVLREYERSGPLPSQETLVSAGAVSLERSDDEDMELEENSECFSEQGKKAEERRVSSIKEASHRAAVVRIKDYRKKHGGSRGREEEFAGNGRRVVRINVDEEPKPPANPKPEDAAPRRAGTVRKLDLHI
jgi:hypothetical protein